MIMAGTDRGTRGARSRPRSISIHFMWDDRPMPERVVAAADAGFDLVDLWDWRTVDIDAIAKAARINGFFGNRQHSACDASDRQAFLTELSESIDCATRVGADQLAIFSNAIRPGGLVQPSPPLPVDTLMQDSIDAVREGAELAGEAGVTLMLEHLNDVYLPGYLWTGLSSVIAVARAVDHPSVRIAVDTYHQQLSGGRITEHLVAALPYLGRFDVGGVPGRHEPGKGEIDFAFLRSVLDEHEWDGVVTFEIVPSDGDPVAAVAAIDRYFPRS
jgi:hydroxypyruvate isomerase